MRKSTITATFSSDVKTVWGIVTDNANYSWRSDIERIEAGEEENTFSEYAGRNFKTNFTITKKIPYERYEFDLSNRNLYGHWTGLFFSTPEGGTRVEFTEEVKIDSPVIRFLSWVLRSIRKQQEAYVEDLRMALGEQRAQS